LDRTPDHEVGAPPVRRRHHRDARGHLATGVSRLMRNTQAMPRRFSHNSARMKPRCLVGGHRDAHRDGLRIASGDRVHDRAVGHRRPKSIVATTTLEARARVVRAPISSASRSRPSIDSASL